MGRKPKSRPSFFKVMFKDFTRHLQLPPMFVQKYGEILSESIKLRTGSGETWNVELEQVDEETYRFTQGRNKFAVDIGLKWGEFLVFWFNIDESMFDVSVYGANCCERQISGYDARVDGSDSDEDVELIKYCTGVENNDPVISILFVVISRKREVKNNQSRAYDQVGKEPGNDDTQVYDYSSEEEAHPQLKLRLKERKKSRVVVCKEFAVATGLTTEKAVVLQYPPIPRCWPVLLIQYPNYSQFRLEMAKGWSEFRKKNGLVFGKTYLLEYIGNKNVIEVKLLNGAN